MASRAFLGRRLVEEDRFALHQFGGLVTGLAAHILMRALQRKTRACFVVEQRWLPLGAVVAVGAGRDLRGIGELQTVNIFVALLALVGSSLEVHVHEVGFHVGRLVTIDTGCGAMCPNQRKCRLGMIELLQLLPGGSGMARLATKRRTVSTSLQHPFLELAPVRIIVANAAGAVLKAIDNSVFSLGRGPLLMAVAAGSRHVSTGELKARVLVPRQGERGGPIALQVMALIAAIEVRSAYELRLVLVFVTVHALGKFQAVDRVLSLGNVTLPALQCGMFEFERIGRLGVILHGVLGRLETLHRVAGAAFAALSPPGKLSTVDVPVTVGALLERDHLLEIAAGVALHTANYLMLAFQRVSGPGVIEFSLDIFQ